MCQDNDVNIMVLPEIKGNTTAAGGTFPHDLPEENVILNSLVFTY